MFYVYINYSEYMYTPHGYSSQFGIPVIMEVGSLNTKIGFAGRDRPDSITPTVSSLLSSMYRQMNKMA